MQTWQLFRAAIDAIGDVAVQQALGYDRSTVHRFGRHPADIDNPDATGKPNPLDRVEGLIARLAVKPGGRTVVRMIRSHVDDLCDEALSGSVAHQAGAACLASHTSDTLREFSEFIGAVAPTELTDADLLRLEKEAAEAVDAIQRTVRAVKAGAR